MSIAIKLKNLIEERNIAKKDIAKIAGVSKGAVSQWLSGETIPKMGRLQKIAIYLGIPVSYFVEDDETKKNMLRTPKEEAELEEYLEAVHNNPDLRMMFSLTKNAKKEDVELAVEIIKKVLSH